MRKPESKQIKLGLKKCKKCLKKNLALCLKCYLIRYELSRDKIQIYSCYSILFNLITVLEDPKTFWYV